MNDIVVFGAGQIAALADHYLRRRGAVVRAFAVDEAHRTSDVFLGRPVVAWEAVTEAYPPGVAECFVAIGYTRLNRLRREKVRDAVAKGYDVAHYVSRLAIRPDDFTPRPNQFILEGCIIEPFVRIGANVTLWSGVHVGHHSTIAEDVFIAPSAVVSGNVSIGARSFIGVNATLRNGVVVGHDCVVGAGVAVLADLPAGHVLDRTDGAPRPIDRRRLGATASSGPSDDHRELP